MRAQDRRQVIRVVERAYDLDTDRRAWLSRILAAALPCLDHGFGVTGCFFDARSAGPIQFGPGTTAGDCPLSGEEAASIMRTDPALAERAFRSPMATCTATELHGKPAVAASPAWAECLNRYGIYDTLGLKAVDASGLRGVFLSAFLPGFSRVRAPLRWRWDRVTAHVGAALRLRDDLTGRPKEGGDGAVGPAPPITEGAAAVLDARFRFLHADGAASEPRARALLKEAAVSMDRARSKRGGSDPDAALELWKALLAGRWSLVEHFEHDGERLIVARVNDPQVAEPRGLTLRERQVLRLAALGRSNKLIAYELGLSLSTIGTHLSRAMAKLGLARRQDLWVLLAPGAAADGDLASNGVSAAETP